MQLAVMLVLSAAAAAQPPLSFEVASVKPSAPVAPVTPGTPVTAGELRERLAALPIPRVDAAHAYYPHRSLMALITTAYKVRTYQVSAPSWLSETYFDVTGKLPEGSSVSQIPEMIQTLLTERFKLAVRVEQKDFDAYLLTTGKDGNKLKQKPADYDPAAYPGMQLVTMPFLATLLAVGDSKPVIDKTGLAGQFLLPEQQLYQAMSLGMASMKRANAAAETASDPDGVDLFSFVQSLGLKLASGKAALPFIVVEHVEKTPTEN